VEKRKRGRGGKNSSRGGWNSDAVPVWGKIKNLKPKIGKIRKAERGKRGGERVL